MTSVICRNGTPAHTHDSVDAVRRCYGTQPTRPSIYGSEPVTSPVATSATSTAPVRSGNVVIRDPNSPPSPAQLSYAKSLGADERALALMSKGQVSQYIDSCKGIHVPDVAPAIATPAPVVDVRPAYVPPAPTPKAVLSEAVIRMLGSVDNGYYAWQPDDATPLVFIRIRVRKVSRRGAPLYGRGVQALQGARVISSQHGPDYTEEAFVFPSGDNGYLRRCNYYERGQSKLIEGSTVELENALVGIIVDKYRAARTYALQKGRCCRCHKDLTDKRSRWYGIGPDCEQIWPAYLEEVDNEKGMTFEEADRAGLAS